jgi:ribonuclease HI
MLSVLQTKLNQHMEKQLYDLLKENSVRFTWVKGHSGIRENELVDQLARDAAKSPTERDDGYEDSL